MTRHRLRNAAILIASLDAHSADALLDEMTPEAAAQVRNAVMELEDIDPAEQQQIIRDFVAHHPRSAATRVATVELDPSLAERLQTHGAEPAAARPRGTPPGGATPFGFLEQIDAADLAIWTVFVADYLVFLYRARDRRAYVRTHIVELVAIIPFNALFKGLRALRIFTIFRSARAFQAVRLLRLFVSFGRTHRYIDRFFRRHNFHYILFFTTSTILLGAVAVGHFENMGFNDSLWWAFVTATTVGYGDIAPVSGGGRIVAVCLMLVGIGFISTLTGTIASFLVCPEADDDAPEMPRNEFVALAIRKLGNFENLSSDEVRDICTVLVSLKSGADGANAGAKR